MHPKTDSKIPILDGSPRRPNHMNETIMINILERLEISQTAIRREIGDMAVKLKDVDGKITNVSNRLSKLESSATVHNKQQDVSGLTNEVHAVDQKVINLRADISNLDQKITGNNMETLITQVIGQVGEVNEKVKKLPSASDFTSVSDNIQQIKTCLTTEVKAKVDDIKATVDKVKDNIMNSTQTGPYKCKGENDRLSNLYRRDMNYKGIEHKSAEHAFQHEHALHVFGGECDLTRQMHDMESPKAVKQLADAEIPFSPSWKKKEVHVLDDIVRCKFDQHQDLKDFLMETGDRQITHNVASKFWGASRFKNGKDIFAKILMAIRSGKPLDLSITDTVPSDSESDQELDSDGSGEASSGWNRVGKPIKLKGDTDKIIIGDSVTEDIDAKMFEQGTEKIKACTLDELDRKVARLVPNENITETFVHVGINEVIDRDEYDISEPSSDRKAKSDRLIAAMQELHDKLPNAKIHYSEALDRDQNPSEFGVVDEFNYNVEVFINRNRKHYVYVGHSINAEFFTDRKHLNNSGNRIFIKHLKDSLGKSHYKNHNRNDNRDHREDHRSRSSKSHDRDKNRRRGDSTKRRSPSNKRDGRDSLPPGRRGGYKHYR